MGLRPSSFGESFLKGQSDASSRRGLSNFEFGWLFSIYVPAMVAVYKKRAAGKMRHNKSIFLIGMNERDPEAANLAVLARLARPWQLQSLLAKGQKTSSPKCLVFKHSQSSAECLQCCINANRSQIHRLKSFQDTQKK